MPWRRVILSAMNSLSWKPRFRPTAHQSGLAFLPGTRSWNTCPGTRTYWGASCPVVGLPRVLFHASRKLGFRRLRRHTLQLLGGGAFLLLLMVGTLEQCNHFGAV
ncbi:hypothetical protein LY76DRAFT_187254 [Colletotrichum caudatum]|nr:hypothetical protein LY76DRAFT_187254 [Colletotrichum caudatum]